MSSLRFSAASPFHRPETSMHGVWEVHVQTLNTTISSLSEWSSCFSLHIEYTNYTKKHMGIRAVEEIDINMAFIILPSEYNCIFNAVLSPVPPIYTTALLMLY